MSITEQQIREIIRQELAAYAECGLLYAKAGSQPKTQPEQKLPEKAELTEKTNFLDLVPDHLINEVDVEPDQARGLWIVKPKHFLGKDTFSELVGVVKKADGKYISAGKDTRFEVPM